jgi:hypothetical protein
MGTTTNDLSDFIDGILVIFEEMDVFETILVLAFLPTSLIYVAYKLIRKQRRSEG